LFDINLPRGPSDIFFPNSVDMVLELFSKAQEVFKGKEQYTISKKYVKA
jgi:hypothetical protein